MRQYHGIGRTTTCNLLRSIGLSINIHPKDIPAHQMARIHRILKQQACALAIRSLSHLASIATGVGQCHDGWWWTGGRACTSPRAGAHAFQYNLAGRWCTAPSARLRNTTCKAENIGGDGNYTLGTDEQMYNLPQIRTLILVGGDGYGPVLRGSVSAPGTRRASFLTRAPPVTF